MYFYLVAICSSSSIIISGHQAKIHRGFFLVFGSLFIVPSDPACTCNGMTIGGGEKVRILYMQCMCSRVCALVAEAFCLCNSMLGR
jgi:hypothetical protein